MVYLYVFLALVGFTFWSFLQNMFVRSSHNINDASRLIFSILVPFLASIFVLIFYSFHNKQSIWNSLNICKSTLVKSQFNFWILIGSALCLALPYFLYPLIMKVDFKYIALISILLTLILVLIGFFVEYREDEIVFSTRATSIEIFGAVITMIGIIIMKFGDQIFRTN